MKVLLLDDEQINRISIGRKVQKCLKDADIIVLSNIQAAREALQQSHFDLAILDWELKPGSAENSMQVIQECIERGIPAMVTTDFPQGTWIDGVFAHFSEVFNRPIAHREVDFYCATANDSRNKLERFADNFAYFVEEHSIRKSLKEK